MQLAQRLVRLGILKPDDLARIAEVHAMTPARPMHELLNERGFAKEEEVLAALADRYYAARGRLAQDPSGKDDDRRGGASYGRGHCGIADSSPRPGVATPGISLLR